MVEEAAVLECIATKYVALGLVKQMRGKRTTRLCITVVVCTTGTRSSSTPATCTTITGTTYTNTTAAQLTPKPNTTAVPNAYPRPLRHKQQSSSNTSNRHLHSSNPPKHERTLRYILTDSRRDDGAAVPDAALPPLARPSLLPAAAPTPDRVVRARVAVAPCLAPYPLLPPAAAAAAAVAALVDRGRVVLLVPAAVLVVPVTGRAVVLLLLPLPLLPLLLLFELPAVRDGDIIDGNAERALALVVPMVSPPPRSGPPPPPVLVDDDAGLARGDNDPAGGGLKPKRLTPGAVGGFTLEGVRAEEDACCVGATGGGGGGAPLSAEVRGERAASGLLLCCCSSCCFPAGVQGPPTPDAEPMERRMLLLPSHSFSLPSRETRRGLRRVPCRASNMLATAACVCC